MGKQWRRLINQTPRSAVYDLGLRCLPISHKRDARLLYGLTQPLPHNAAYDQGLYSFIMFQKKN